MLILFQQKKKKLLSDMCDDGFVEESTICFRLIPYHTVGLEGYALQMSSDAVLFRSISSYVCKVRVKLVAYMQGWGLVFHLTSKIYSFWSCAGTVTLS